MGATFDPIAAAAAKEQGKKYDVEDFASASVRFRNGAMLLLQASWAANIRERELMETRILGTKGGLVQRNLNEGYDFEGEIFTERNGTQFDSKPHAPIPNAPGAMHHFVDSIVNRKPHMATGDEGETVMVLLDAIYRSARTRKPVKVG
jgi:predicted dehydrogenase